MPPSDTYVRASERKRARSEKRHQKKHLKNNKNNQKSKSNSWTAFGKNDRSSNLSNKIKVNGHRRKRPYEEKEESFKSNRQTSPASISNGNYDNDDDDDDSTTALLGSHKKREQRQKIQFVYPRSDGNTRALPFELSSKKTRQKDTTKTGGEASSQNLASENNKSEKFVRPSKESIEDILYSSKKKKQKMEHEEKPSHGSSPKLELDKYSVQEEMLQPSTTTTDQKTTSEQEHKKKSKSKKKKKKKQPEQMKQHQQIGSPESAVDETDSQRGQLSGLSVQDAVRDKAGCRPRSNSTDGELNLPRRGLCDEHAVLESHRWNTMSLGGEHSTAAPPRGFINLGNTCYLNSTLQCLFHLPTFCQSLLALPPSFTQSFNSKKVSSGQKMTALLRTLIRKAHNLDTVDGKKGSAMAPRDVVRAVPTIGAGMNGGGGYKFRPGRQEDAHEFLVHLLDAMKDGELKAAGINQRQSGWRDRLPIPRLDETTLIHRIFGGYLRSQVRCTSCNYLSNTYDPFMDLALEVSKKSSNSIASAFSEFARKEKLDSANRWKCSGCKKHVCPLKQLTVFRPPLSLCIQLKRFTFGGGFGGFHAGFGHFHGGGRGGSKISKPIEFPAELKLPLSDGRTCAYTLTGIVIHVGGSASSGHYTAYVKRQGTKGKTQWYHMDDSFVEAVSEKTVLRQKDAYVLFYCRKEVKLEFTTPVPRGSMSASEAKHFGEKRARARANSITSDSGTKESTASPTSIKEPVGSSSESESSDEKPMVRSFGIDTNPVLSENLKSQGKRNDKQITPSAASKKISDLELQQSQTHTPSSSDDSSFAPGSGSESEDDSLDLPSGGSSPKKESRERHSSSDSSSDESSVEGNALHTTKGNPPQSFDHVLGTKKSRMVKAENSSGEEKTQTKNLSSLSKSNAKSKSTLQQPKPASSSSSSESSSTSDSEEDSSESSDDSSEERKPSGLPTLKSASSRQTKTNDANYSSSSGSSSGSDSSDSDESYSEENRTKDNCTVSTKQAVAKVPKEQQKVSLDRGKARGRVEVVVGQRNKKKSWKPKTIFSCAKGNDQDRELLGGVGVGKWDDDDEYASGDTSDKKQQLIKDQRSGILKKMEKQEKSRKRKMHLDKWDSALDEGRTKKVKMAKTNDEYSGVSIDPKKNQFQRIQSSIQRMQRGRAKGLVRQQQQEKQQLSKKGNFKNGGRKGTAPFRHRK